MNAKYSVFKQNLFGGVVKKTFDESRRACWGLKNVKIFTPNTHTQSNERMIFFSCYFTTENDKSNQDASNEKGNCASKKPLSLPTLSARANRPKNEANGRYGTVFLQRKFSSVLVPTCREPKQIRDSTQERINLNLRSMQQETHRRPTHQSKI